MEVSLEVVKNAIGDLFYQRIIPRQKVQLTVVAKNKNEGRNKLRKILGFDKNYFFIKRLKGGEI